MIYWNVSIGPWNVASRLNFKQLLNCTHKKRLDRVPDMTVRDDSSLKSIPSPAKPNTSPTSKMSTTHLVLLYVLRWLKMNQRWNKEAVKNWKPPDGITTAGQPIQKQMAISFQQECEAWHLGRRSVHGDDAEWWSTWDTGTTQELISSAPSKDDVT